MNIVFETRTADSASFFTTTVYQLTPSSFFLVIRYSSAVDPAYDFFLNGGQMFDSLAKAKDAATMQITDFLSVEVAP